MKMAAKADGKSEKKKKMKRKIQKVNSDKKE